MNVELIDVVYKELKENIQENSKYSPNIVKKALKSTKKFPLITLIESNDEIEKSDIRMMEIISRKSFEINIYAIDIGLTSNVEIIKELKRLVDDVMVKTFKMRRFLCEPTPNLDDTIERLTMRYKIGVMEKRNRLF